MPAPFKIYADFECIIKSVKNNEKTSGSYTKKYQDHIPCSFAYKLVCVDNNPAGQLFFTGVKMKLIMLLRWCLNSLVT